MEDLKLIGEYNNITKKVFTRREALDIADSVIRGHNIVKIAKNYKVSEKVITAIFKEFIINKFDKDNLLITGCLGFKNVEYCSEEVLLNYDPKEDYTWEKLGTEEKLFYLNYGREKK